MKNSEYLDLMSSLGDTLLLRDVATAYDAQGDTDAILVYNRDTDTIRIGVIPTASQPMIYTVVREYRFDDVAAAVTEFWNAVIGVRQRGEPLRVSGDFDVRPAPFGSGWIGYEVCMLSGTHSTVVARRKRMPDALRKALELVEQDRRQRLLGPHSYRIRLNDLLGVK